MELQQAKTMALELMEQHGLIADGWTFEWDFKVKRWGICRHSNKTIGLTIEPVLANDESSARDTILHEIAHALVGHGAGHGKLWKDKCREIGARPERLVNFKYTKRYHTKTKRNAVTVIPYTDKENDTANKVMELFLR